MESAAKQRNPRNREWEKQRRNKFNDAISKLGDLVKAINKANNATADEDNAQYPKIEIIQKAILCLTSCAQEKTQLKAEILALQVKLDTAKCKTVDTKEASTQVYITINKKKKNGKFVKVVMLEKSPSNSNKKKANANSEIRANPSPPKLPMLLPRTNINDKKGTENTIVVLPATPYLFPQRPFLIPSMPPAIVLVDPNVQALNKTSVPIGNRNNGDITKTTMVNILPISAYSRPLSATKNKKHTVKLKSDVNKKVIKKPNTSEIAKEIIQISSLKEKPNGTTDKPSVNGNSNAIDNENNCSLSQTSQKMVNDKEAAPSLSSKTKSLDNTNQLNPRSVVNNKEVGTSQTNLIEITDTITAPKSSNINITKSPPVSITAPTTDVESKTEENKEENKTNKLILPKEAVNEIKEKDSKLRNILDQPLCDNTVDGGNARLELAEEFLAASPTAAFLMSFPLVSGNRADSPADESAAAQSTAKDVVNQRRNELTPTQQNVYFEKPVLSDSKVKAPAKTDTTMLNQNKSSEQEKCIITNIASKQLPPTTSTVTKVTTSENPFLNLSMPSLITTSCTLTDSTFGLDFDCTLSKPLPNQPTNFTSTSNIFYKSDPFNTVKSTIYSTSNISSNHDFNNLGLYPCAMEKYTSKNKPDYANMEDSLMKIGSSRLTYDIDLGWSHKSFDFVNCTTASSSFTKDSILPTSSVPYSSSYNPFNPEFHVPLVSSSNKRDNATSKPTSSFPESVTSFYSQATNLWSDDVPFYSNGNVTKPSSNKHQNYIPFDHASANALVKTNVSKHYDMKETSETLTNVAKPVNINSQAITEKYTKKSPHKMHINWMTSEIRPMQTNCNPTVPEIKEIHKPSYTNLNHKAPYNSLDNINNKKQDHNESNYFPISMHNYPPQASQEEFQGWPSTRPLGTAEVSIEPPPINLPTLVGDLALGPHDKKKNSDPSNRVIPHNDVQNCGNFLSVTQLMNRSSDHPRYQATNVEISKSNPTKQNMPIYTNDHSRKGITSSRMENNPTEPYYVLNDPKIGHNYENTTQYPQIKPKSNSKTEKSSKAQKNSYSAEALIRSGNCNLKIQDGNNPKFMSSSQKFNDFIPQESGMAQISHYPPILDYSENAYVSQQFSGTTLYNTTTNTISNSFYSNFMPGTSNLISSNYAAGHFTGDFMDYNQTTECNYSNHKYEDLKMRNNSMVCLPEKGSSNYKTSRKESATKHKLECTKKESNKKFQSKRAKLNTEVEEWVEPNLMLWQNKSTNKRHTNLMSEEIPFPNYVSNQVPTQYQPEFFNSHLMPSNMQNVGHNVDRSLASFPVTSRANFNLSTIFPEITMKVQ